MMLVTLMGGMFSKTSGLNSKHEYTSSYSLLEVNQVVLKLDHDDLGTRKPVDFDKPKWNATNATNRAFLQESVDQRKIPGGGMDGISSLDNKDGTEMEERRVLKHCDS
ncbi:hypothetical protein Tco_0513756 [Tanacetum coccineum]